MGLAFYATLALVTVWSVSCTNLFVSPIGRSMKARLHADILNKVKTGLGPERGTDGTIAAVVSEAPILTAQSLMTVLVYANSAAQLFNLLQQYETPAVKQSLWMTALVKLVDAFSEVSIAPFSERDDMFTTDLVDRASIEMRVLANAKASSMLAYSLLCMCATSHAHGCLLPILIGELPGLLRTAYILLEATMPQGARLARDGGLKQLLFPMEAAHPNVTHNATAATTATPRLDELCDTVSSGLEVYVVVRMMFSLLSFRSGLRSASNMALLIVQVLLLQNYLSVRAQSLLSGRTGDLNSLVSSALSTQVAETVRSGTRQLTELLQEIRTVVLDPAARSALLRNTLHRWGPSSGRKAKPKRIRSPRRVRRANPAKTAPTMRPLSEGQSGSDAGTDDAQAQRQQRPQPESSTGPPPSDDSS